MKRMRKVFVLLMIIVLISGCTIKTEYDVEIRSDKSMEISTIMAFDEQLINAMASSDSETDDMATNDEVTANDNTGLIDDTTGGTANDDSTAVEGTTDGTISGGTDNTTDDSTITSDGTTQTLTDEEQWKVVEDAISSEELEDAGYTVSRYNEDGFKGYKVSKTFSNIEDITYGDIFYSEENSELMAQTTTESSTTINNNEPIFTKDGNNYKFNFPIEDTGELSSMGVVFDMQLVVTFPNKPESHNATSVSEDGKTLTWNLLSLDGDAEATFALNDNLVMYIAIGVAILLVLIIIVLVVKNKGKKKKNSANNSINTPIAPIPSPVNTPQTSQSLNNQASSTQTVQTLNNQTSNIQGAINTPNNASIGPVPVSTDVSNIQTTPISTNIPSVQPTSNVLDNPVPSASMTPTPADNQENTRMTNSTISNTNLNQIANNEVNKPNSLNVSKTDEIEKL